MMTFFNRMFIQPNATILDFRGFTIAKQLCVIGPVASQDIYPISLAGKDGWSLKFHPPSISI
jgi:hypothetical protein